MGLSLRRSRCGGDTFPRVTLAHGELGGVQETSRGSHQVGNKPSCDLPLSPLASPPPSREVGQCCLHHFVEGKTAAREDRGLCSGIWAHRGTPQQ